MASTTGCRAYRLRAADPTRTWASIAAELGVRLSTAHACAYLWATTLSLDWPLGRTCRGRGADYYDARAQGLSWRDVGARWGVSANAAYTAARGWALSRQRPWPIRRRWAGGHSHAVLRQVAPGSPGGTTGAGPAGGAHAPAPLLSQAG